MRIVIVGGGLAGLAAAALAAKKGHQVRLFEKATAPGGRAATREVEGFSLNLGAHALYPAGAGERVLGELGVGYQGGAPSVGGFAIDGGALRTLPVGFVSMLSTSLLSLGAKVELAKLLASIGDLDPGAHMDEPLRHFIDRTARAPSARRYLGALFRLTTYSADHDRYSAGVALALLQRVVRTNVVYLDGGWRTLVDGLEAAARAAGADVVTGERVEAIEMENGGVARVRLASGPSCPADAVIVAASPSAASTLAPASAALRREANASVPCQAACLDLALSRLPVPRTRFALGIDRPLYFSVHSAAARLAPDGGAIVHAAYYRSGDEDPSTLEPELEAMVDRLQPGWRAHVVDRRFMPKLTVTNAIPTAERGGLAGRPRASVADLPGLYVAGDWVGATGCLADASLGSASDAVEAATRDLAARGPHRSAAALA